MPGPPPPQPALAALPGVPRPRLRGVPEPDIITFTAACPACGQDAAWTNEREDTRLRAAVDCPCA